MKIRRLTIRRMPGFGDGGPAYDDLADGLNVIVGPNASGKTTTCRAITGLLWPETLADLKPVSIEGIWRDDEGEILIDVEARHRTCQRDGVRYDGPALPPADRARCFTVTIDDLFAGSDTDDGLAAEIARELAGGYDLPAVRTDVTAFAPVSTRNACKALQQARRDARSIRAEHEALRGEEGSKAQLEAQAAEATQAVGRLARLQDVRDLLRLRGEIAAAEAAIQSFPEGMDRLLGNEADVLAKLREDLDALADKLTAAERQADEAAQNQTETNLPDGGITAVRLEEQQDHLTALAGAERDLADAEKALRQAETQRNEALSRLGAIGDADHVDVIDTAGLDEVDAFLRDFETSRASMAAVNARLDMLDHPEPPGDTVEALAHGMGILREWLESGPANTAVGRQSVALVWILSGLLAVTGITLAITVSAWWIALAGPALAAVFVARGAGPQKAPDRRADRQAAFDRTGLDAPEAWTPDAVGRRITAFEQAIVQAREAQSRAERRREARQRLEHLSDQADALETRRLELTKRLGVTVGTSVLALTDLAANVRAYRTASSLLVSARADATAADLARRNHLEQVNAFLVEFGLDACESCDVGRTRTREIQRRATQYADATTALAAARKEADDARRVTATLEARKRDLLAAAGLGDGDEAVLAERLGRLEGYREAVGLRDDLKTQTAALTARLDGADDLTSMTPEQVEAEAARLEALAASRDELVGTIKEIELKIKQAGSGHRLEEALAAADEAQEAVDRRRTTALRAAAGAFLLDEIEAEYRTESEPDVLRRAREWFAQFTHHRYTLQARTDGGEGGQAAFGAVDATTGRGLGLDELSRGTRMQLLLAVRLAFAAAAEGATQLPFILDEVLSSSDPERFEAIVDCLLVLVGAGRQVFYFTCQPGDARAWDEAARAAGITDARLIDLGQPGRDGATAAGALGESTTSRRQTPAPDGAALDEYARTLGAAPLRPAAGAAGAHVAHVLDDAEQLYRLAQARIETVGQLRQLCALTGADGTEAYIASGARAAALARADLLDAFADAWSVGRGKPLTREDLTDAGVSGTFIDDVATLARELDRDAGRLIEAIEAGGIKRFHKKTIETMRDRLTDSGHLSASETLDEQSARAHVLAAATGQVSAGVLTVDEVARRFETWWRMCDGAAGEA